MVIEFLCPNGHKIRCADDRANKPAKCPKCGVKFYVPGPEESEPSESGSWATAPVQASGSPGSSSSQMASRDQIEFLCPNGHRLWAAVGLQGRPGQCPECGSKFHIPTLADYEQRPPARPAPEDSVINLEDFAATVLGGNSSGKQSGVLPLAGARDSLQIAAAGPSRAVGFLTRLAEDLPEGATLELWTRDGKMLRPEQFATELCDRQTLAFSVAAEDDTHTLFLLPWETLARIEIRGIKRLPEEFS